jgi:hypothetical protein
MNNISWFLYAVDVLRTVGGVSKALLVAGLIVLIISFGGWLISRAALKCEKDGENPDGYSARCWDTWHKTWRIGLMVSVPVFVVSLFFATLIPSSKTMYLIMGSEVGEEVVKSETGQRVQDAINKKLDEYLDDSSE